MGKQIMEGKRLNAFAVDPDDLVIIGFDTDDGPEHPLYDKRCKLPVDENLARDMLMNGFRGSIEVRKNGDSFEVVFGRQRVKAARRANELAKEAGREPVAITCQVKKGSDADLMGVRLGENIHRRGLGLLDTAEELKRYLNLGRTEDEAAITFGMTKANIKNLMRLHDLDPQVRKAVESGDLKPSAAAELADLSRDEQKEELAKILAAAEKGEKPTVRAVKKAMKKKTGEGANVAPPKRLINAVLKLNDKHGKVLNQDFVRGILWTLGDMPSTTIKGLRDLENEFEEIKNARSKKGKKGAEA